MVHHDGLSEKNPFPFKGRSDPGGRKNKTHAGGTFISVKTIQHKVYSIQQVDRQCNDDTSHKITSASISRMTHGIPKKSSTRITWKR